MVSHLQDIHPLQRNQAVFHLLDLIAGEQKRRPGIFRPDHQRPCVGVVAFKVRARMEHRQLRPAQGIFPPGGGEVDLGVGRAQPVSRLEQRRLPVAAVGDHQRLRLHSGKQRLRPAAVVLMGMGQKDIFQPLRGTDGHLPGKVLRRIRRAGVDDGALPAALQQHGQPLAHIRHIQGQALLLRRAAGKGLPGRTEPALRIARRRQKHQRQRQRCREKALPAGGRACFSASHSFFISVW